MAEEKKVEVKEEIAEVKPDTKRNMVANLEEGIYSSSDTFVLASQMAKGLAQSTIVPMQFQKNVPNCLIALELANRFHTSPLMIMQNTYIIQGKPSFSSSFLIAMVNASGKYDQELAFDEKKDKDGNVRAYKIVVTLGRDGNNKKIYAIFLFFSQFVLTLHAFSGFP